LPPPPPQEPDAQVGTRTAGPAVLRIAHEAMRMRCGHHRSRVAAAQAWRGVACARPLAATPQSEENDWSGDRGCTVVRKQRASGRVTVARAFAPFACCPSSPSFPLSFLPSCPFVLLLCPLRPCPKRRARDLETHRTAAPDTNTANKANK
jgi:hypothetical protein